MSPELPLKLKKIDAAPCICCHSHSPQHFAVFPSHQPASGTPHPDSTPASPTIKYHSQSTGSHDGRGQLPVGSGNRLERDDSLVSNLGVTPSHRFVILVHLVLLTTKRATGGLGQGCAPWNGTQYSGHIVLERHARASNGFK